MEIIKTAVTIADIIFIIIFLFFQKPLKWQKDKASIIGFTSLILCLLANIALIWI